VAQAGRATPVGLGLDRFLTSDHDSHVKAVGVAELKANLSRYLEHVKGGQEVVITERGLPVAKLVPLGGGERLEARRERLARAGLLQLGRGRIRTSVLKPPRGPVAAGRGVLQALLAERRDAR
jgi:prevent-host-death family protein